MALSMLLEQTRNYVTGLNDEALIEYLQIGVEMYEPDAVAFARDEYGRRNLDPERMAQIERGVKARLAAQSAEVAELRHRPLGRLGRSLSVIAGFGGLPLIPLFLIWLHLRGKGEHRKASELWTFALLGFAGMMLLLLLTTVLKPSMR
jgi:hypothetical protein